MNMTLSVIRYNPEDADMVVQLAGVLEHSAECVECTRAMAENEEFRANAHEFINGISGLPIPKDDWEAYARICARYLQVHLLTLGDNTFRPDQKVIEIPN